MIAKNRPAVRLACALAGIAALAVPAAAPAAEILEVSLDEERIGVVHVGLREADGATPSVTANDAAVEVAVESREDTIQWQPLIMMVDTSNITQERLDLVKKNMLGLARRELESGSKLVIISDQRGVGAEGVNVDAVGGALKTTMESFQLVPNPDPRGRKASYSTISPFLGKRLGSVPLPKAQPWALVFSSLCVAADDEPPESLKGFKGPIRILTWNNDLHPSCKPNRDAWLDKLGKIRDDVEVYDLDNPAEKPKIDEARKGRGSGKDQLLTLTGVPYAEGFLKLQVAVDGAKTWENTWKEDALPGGWLEAAAEAKQKKVRIGAAVAFGLMVLLVVIIALTKARSGGKDVAKWEAVGEAEDLSSSMDPDAWNATIFQLTGAMPALKEVREAAQLGPSGTTTKGAEPTVDAPAPTAPEGATATTPTTSPSSGGGDLPSTGMTVAMPVLDDGTGYDAERPFEIGVLLAGKPVARKTKKFRKVFSIGRATDNRVVIQKDDTVHRYHVVVRPALQGKEWWLEVSPTSTNRTNLNGKDLRPGGRYRLPARFRLQLGEATEVRGRLSGE